MDKLLSELLSTAAAPLIAALSSHTEELQRNNDLLERVVAGQTAAIAKLEGTPGAAAAGTRRPRRTKAEMEADAAAATPSTSTPAAGEEPVAADVDQVHPLLASPNSETAMVTNPRTQVQEPTPTANYRAGDFSRDQVKSEFLGWLVESDDKDVRAQRASFVAAIGQHFGVKQIFHPTEGLADDEQRKQTLFFLRRKRAGGDVNFSADYDFDDDPVTQGAAAAEDDGFDALG